MRSIYVACLSLISVSLTNSLISQIPINELSSLCADCYTSLRNEYNINEFWWQGANEWTTIASMFSILIDINDSTIIPNIPSQFDAMPNFKMNCYNDDGLWWVLAYYELYLLSLQINNNHLANFSSTNFQNGLTDIMEANYNNEISSICSPFGILWCNTDKNCKKCNCGCPYKNAIANELFLDALIKAKNTFSDYYNDIVIGKYGYNFDDILQWFVNDSGMISNNYQILDGLDYNTCAAKGGIYSYNQGVILNSLIQSGKYNNILFGILQESFNVYTNDNNDGFGRRWIHDSCSNSDPSDGTIFDSIFIRYLTDILPELLIINSNLANNWINVIENTVNKIRYNNQTGASDLYPCPLDYLLINSSTNLNKTVKYNVWIKSITNSSDNNNIFLAMNNNGNVYNYIGNAVNNNDQGNPGWILESYNNGESYCIYNPWINSQSNNKYNYLSSHTLGSNCNQNIWNGKSDYGDVIVASDNCLRDELFYIELHDSSKGIYSIRCAKCNLSPDISSTDHPMYAGMYNGGPGYNINANNDEQYYIYSQDTKQQILDLDYIQMKDTAMNQLTQYTTLQWFVAGLKIEARKKEFNQRKSAS